MLPQAEVMPSAERPARRARSGCAAARFAVPAQRAAEPAPERTATPEPIALLLAWFTLDALRGAYLELEGDLEEASA